MKRPMTSPGPSRLLAPLLALLLVTATLGMGTALAQGQSGRDKGEDERDERGDRSDEARDDDSGKGRGRGRGGDEARGPLAMGGFKRGGDRGPSQGDYVSFQAAPGGIANFTVEGEPLFALRPLAPATGGGRAPDVDAKGAVTKVRGTGYTFVAHDTPTAEARFTGARGFALTLADGVSAEAGDRRVTLTAGDVRATLYGKDLTLSGRELTGPGAIHFLVHGEKAPWDPARDVLEDEKIAGRVGAEVLVKHAPEQDNRLLDAVVAFGNVTVETIPEDEGVTFVVSGHEGDPRVLILNVDGALLDNASVHDLRFRFDNESIRPATSLADILDPDNDDGAAEYYIVSDMNGTLQAIVSIPHYSVHTVSIQSIASLVPPAVSVAIGVVAAGAFLMLATVALFRRPKQD